MVPRDGKRGQRGIAVLLAARIVPGRKVATVDMRPAKIIGVASLRIEIRPQDFLLLFRRHFFQGYGCGLGEGTAKTLDLLIGNHVVNPDGSAFASPVIERLDCYGGLRGKAGGKIPGGQPA